MSKIITDTKHSTTDMRLVRTLYRSEWAAIWCIGVCSVSLLGMALTA